MSKAAKPRRRAARRKKGPALEAADVAPGRLDPVLAEKVELWPLDRLRPYESNPRRHPERQLEQLAASITRFGFVDPILVDGDAGILAGHGRLEAARRLGLERVPVIRLDHLGPDERRAVRVAHNRLGELSTWDRDLLAGELSELSEDGSLDPETLGFLDEEVDKLLDEVAGEEALQVGSAGAADDQVDEPSPADAFPEPPPHPIPSSGELWACGPHRILCADAFDEPALEPLLEGRKFREVLTDPPYAIFGSSTGMDSSVADDRMVRPFFRRVFELCAAVLEPLGTAHLFCDWRTWSAIWEEARRTTISVRNMLIWDKGGTGLGASYMNGHELLAYCINIPTRTKVFNYKRDAGKIRPVNAVNVLRHPRVPRRDRHHNAAKPVAMLEELLGHVSEPGALVFDPFLGSGSTLVAAARSERILAAVEVEPKWVQVALERWERLTGEKAHRVGDNATLEQAERGKKKTRRAARAKSSAPAAKKKAAPRKAPKKKGGRKA